MSNTYLTTEELAERIKYNPRTIRNDLKDHVLLEGRHYIRPFVHSDNAKSYSFGKPLKRICIKLRKLPLLQRLLGQKTMSLLMMYSNFFIKEQFIWVM